MNMAEQVGELADSNGSSCTKGIVLEPLTVVLPPIEPIHDNQTEKRSRRGRSKVTSTTTYCTAKCKHGGKCVGDMVQCHICQTWAHYDCVGEDKETIIGIWTCQVCRALPSNVQNMLDTVKRLETTVLQLNAANELLVTLIGEQRQEIAAMRDQLTCVQMTTPASQKKSYAGAAQTNMPQKTLLVGNSLLRDVHEATTDAGNPVDVVCKSGASMSEIADAIDSSNGHISDMIIVCGTREAAGSDSIDSIDSTFTHMIERAKAKSSTVTVSSVLPTIRNAKHSRTDELNRTMKGICNGMGVAFVDNDANFVFRDGTCDESAFHRDGLHLSANGTNRLLRNLKLQQRRENNIVPRSDYRRERGNWVQPTVNGSRYRRVPGQCAMCGETNHVTSRCRHRVKVTCRLCNELGHKEKHHRDH